MKIKIIDKDKLNNKKINKLLQKCLYRFLYEIKPKLNINIKNLIKINIIKETEFNKKVNIKGAGFKAFCDASGIYVIPYTNNLLELLRLLKHEIVHFVLLKQYNCTEDWVQEGCAVYFSKQLKSLCKKLKPQNNLLLSELIDKFTHSEKHYLYSAVYINFLFNKHKNIFFELLKDNIEVLNFESEALYFFTLDKD